ncbi:MAG: aminotransferase class III-fold pyridoxal phosphate-dependent enzyme, partial [Alphaproteobacteria bacterium]|nr:aminotransferase class III-fold pyridoxal phosphate-dependent enzyme [Alphaproteobacteria bacterium]
YVPFNDEKALAAAMDESVCAVMLEPIQGEGGVYPATRDYLRAARKLCDQYDALLILDEVQTGVGRTGKWFAHQHFGVTPDVMTLAKALGGGMPIGACLARGDAATTLVPGDHASTFGGNPVVASAANAVLATIEEEQLCSQTQEKGDYLARRLKEELGGQIVEIRGLGLMIGIELARPVAKKTMIDALKAGLIINAIGDNILRLLPPLILDESDIEKGVAILKDVLA